MASSRPGAEALCHSAVPLKPCALELRPCAKGPMAASSRTGCVSVSVCQCFLKELSTQALCSLAWKILSYEDSPCPQLCVRLSRETGQHSVSGGEEGWPTGRVTKAGRWLGPPDMLRPLSPVSSASPGVCQLLSQFVQDPVFPSGIPFWSRCLGPGPIPPPQDLGPSFAGSAGSSLQRSPCAVQNWGSQHGAGGQGTAAGHGPLQIP